MPNRILRDWTDSEPVNTLSPVAERFFVRLIMKADDFGRQTANPKLLRPLLYPLLLDQVREADLQRLIAECVKAGLVRHYGVGGKQYLEIQNFKQRTRANLSKFPQPVEGTPDVSQMTVTRPSRDGPPLTETETDAETETAAFGRFWSAWPKHPRKSDRKRCTEKWKAEGLAKLVDRIVASVEAHKGSPDWTEAGGKYIPAPLVWLNRQGWEAPVEDAGEEPMGISADEANDLLKGLVP
jgi:hypothetical protein